MKARIHYLAEDDMMAIELWDAETKEWVLSKAFPCCAIEEGGPTLYLHLDIVHEILHLIRQGYKVSGFDF